MIEVLEHFLPVDALASGLKHDISRDVEKDLVSQVYNVASSCSGEEFGCSCEQQGRHDVATRRRN